MFLHNLLKGCFFPSTYGNDYPKNYFEILHNEYQLQNTASKRTHDSVYPQINAAQYLLAYLFHLNCTKLAMAHAYLGIGVIAIL